ncbi:MAG: type II toxin-antitoxin system HigB family toxin [Blastocatellia bacterium]
MHIISNRPLREFWEVHPDAQAPLEDWWRITKAAKWNNPAETRRDFPHADPVGECTVFNIGGNKYRLIAKNYYEDKVVLVRFVLTHPQYDRGGWKNDCK